MPSEIEVKYDDKRPWDPLGEGWIVPYVQFEREPVFYGGKWGQTARITLTGKVPLGRIVPTGLFTIPYPQRVILFNNVRDEIVEVFSKSLKEFYFKDTQGNEMRFKNAVVENIDFPNSGYHGTLEYSISLKCHEQDYFMAQGIMDAKDEFQTTENENGTIQVTHSISAKGIDYEDASGLNHGLSNAISWVDSRKGDDYKSEQGIYKAWHGGTKSGLANPTIHLLLLNQEEKINRLTGQYEVTETFMGYLDSENNTGVAGGTKKYGKKFTVDINESLNADFNIVTVTGEYRGGKESSLGELRTGFLNDNGGDPEGMMFTEAQRLSGFDGAIVDPTCTADCVKKPTLFNVPYNYNIEENETDKVIKIKATFDTNPFFGDDKYYFDYKVSVKLDEIRKISKVSIEGELKARGLSTERQFHIKDFLDTEDVMDYLWQRADAQHALVMKECWQCATMGWVRTGIGEDINDANGYCQDLGDTLLSTEPERCHELGKGALSISVTKNEVKNQLNMSATFSDEDTLPLSTENCYQCWNNANEIVGIVYVDTEDLDEVLAECPEPEENTVTACAEGSLKDYGPVSYTVDVINPIEYVKAHASAQAQYNGHWSIQKFGIDTRAKSNTKVNLTFREDAGVIAKFAEPTLRAKSLEIQETLNSMLSQNELYDVSENISHKVSKADSINHNLERSYVPEEEKVICVDIPEIEDSKYCYMCLDENNEQIGSKVYAIDTTQAQELCDQKESDLTPSSCDNCWDCLNSDGTLREEVFATTQQAAQAQCLNGTVQRCNQGIDEDCYKCQDVLDGMFASEVYAVSQTAAQIKCDEQWSADATVAVACPTDPPGSSCYICFCDGQPLATLVATNVEEALIWCNWNYGNYCTGDSQMSADDCPEETTTTIEPG